jgi:hypothetical protein
VEPERIIDRAFQLGPLRFGSQLPDYLVEDLHSIAIHVASMSHGAICIP